MDIRKIAVAAGFACGAALAFAPLAAADLGSTVDSTLSAEINSQNSILETYAALTGTTADITKNGSGVYDSINQSVTPQLFPGGSTNPLVPIGEGASYGQVTPLENLIYGTNPIVAGISGTTGPYNEYNGALTQFYDAYNVYAYAAANNGALDTNVSDYLGSTSTIAKALDTGTLAGASQYFYNFGLGDLKGYEADFVPGQTTAGDIHPFIASEIGQLNTLFEQDGQLAGVYKDILPNINSTQGTYINFDTISPDDTTKAFDQLVFGLNPANVSGDPGSYDVFNGASVEFFNAENVGLYALLNNGALLPSADIFGTHAEAATVAASLTEYLNLGFQDLLGYFIPAATATVF